MEEDGAIKPRPYPNVEPLFGFLISQGLCTLNELRTIYTLGDAFYLYEAVAVPRYNEWREMKAQENKAKR